MLIALRTPILGPSPSPVTGTSPSPDSATPSCSRNSDLCHFIYERTHQAWLAESGYWMLVKPLRILLIVVLILVARSLIHRTINQIIRRTWEPDHDSLLAPLRERLTPALRVASVVPNERRKQRAEALGSVLRSTTSVTLAALGVMLVLAEFGVNLGPILAGAGIVGVALGFGAQNLVRDFLAGMFILMEDQFGVGDYVELSQMGGSASGQIEAVGLRITTLRDEVGSIWYLRNGEIIRVGNKSQGWSLVVVDVLVGFADIQEATETIRKTAAELAADPEWAKDITEPPQVLGVEEITGEQTQLRTTIKTTQEAQPRLARELRRRITVALSNAGLAGENSGVKAD